MAKDVSSVMAMVKASRAERRKKEADSKKTAAALENRADLLFAHVSDVLDRLAKDIKGDPGTPRGVLVERRKLVLEGHTLHDWGYKGRIEELSFDNLVFRVCCGVYTRLNTMGDPHPKVGSGKHIFFGASTRTGKDDGIVASKVQRAVMAYSLPNPVNLTNRAEVSKVIRSAALDMIAGYCGVPMDKRKIGSVVAGA